MHESNQIQLDQVFNSIPTLSSTPKHSVDNLSKSKGESGDLINKTLVEKEKTPHIEKTVDSKIDKNSEEIRSKSSDFSIKGKANPSLQNFAELSPLRKSSTYTDTLAILQDCSMAKRSKVEPIYGQELKDPKKQLSSVHAINSPRIQITPNQNFIPDSKTEDNEISQLEDIALQPNTATQSDNTCAEDPSKASVLIADPKSTLSITVPNSNSYKKHRSRSMPFIFEECSQMYNAPSLHQLLAPSPRLPRLFPVGPLFHTDASTMSTFLASPSHSHDLPSAKENTQSNAIQRNRKESQEAMPILDFAALLRQAEVVRGKLTELLGSLSQIDKLIKSESGVLQSLDGRARWTTLKPHLPLEPALLRVIASNWQRETSAAVLRDWIQLYRHWLTCKWMDFQEEVRLDCRFSEDLESRNTQSLGAQSNLPCDKPSNMASFSTAKNKKNESKGSALWKSLSQRANAMTRLLNTHQNRVNSSLKSRLKARKMALRYYVILCLYFCVYLAYLFNIMYQSS